MFGFTFKVDSFSKLKLSSPFAFSFCLRVENFLSPDLRLKLDISCLLEKEDMKHKLILLIRIAKENLSYCMCVRSLLEMLSPETY